jgi:hypothetical protein
MSLVRCKDCGLHFERAADEAWKVRCIPCFKKSKRAELLSADSYWIDRATAAESLAETLQRKVAHLEITVSNLVGQSLRQPPPSRLDLVLAEHWRALVQLVHPDKHGGSQGATRLTQWLNDIKGRLPCA